MEVESYLIEGAEDLISDVEQLDEYKKLVQELGLEGQQELLGENGTPCPFPAMDITVKRTLETLFPNKDDISAFKAEAIPLRILSLIALAKQEGYFNHIQIWHQTNMDDPVVVGIIGESTFSGAHHMIGRWGKALKPMEELTNMAIDKKKTEYASQAQKRIGELQGILSDPAVEARKYMNGGFVHI